MGPGTFGCGRLGLVFMAFRFMQRRMRRRGKQNHKKGQLVHLSYIYCSVLLFPTVCTLYGTVVLGKSPWTYSISCDADSEFRVAVTGDHVLGCATTCFVIYAFFSDQPSRASV